MNDVVFVVNRLYGGGAERVVSVLANSLCRKGYHVTIVCFKKSESNYQLDSSIEIKRLEGRSRFLTLKKVKRIIKLRKFLNKKNCAVIAFEYFVNMQAALASLFLGNRLIISERNDPARVGNHLNILRNTLYSLADVLVCQTDAAKLFFPKKIRRSTVVIPNPVPLYLPDPYVGERTKEIVTFCRVEAQKNLTLLVDSFRRLSMEFPEYCLLIYGNGSKKDELKKYIVNKNLQDKIQLLDPVPDIHYRVQKCAMYINSSDYEGMSNSMLEALAIGLPVIATDCPCGGAHAVIKSGENGILVPVNNPFALYKAMKRVINNSDYARKLSQNGAAIRTKLSADKICGLWESIIRKE